MMEPIGSISSTTSAVLRDLPRRRTPGRTEQVRSRYQQASHGAPDVEARRAGETGSETLTHGQGAPDVKADLITRMATNGPLKYHKGACPAGAREVRDAASWLTPRHVAWRALNNLDHFRPDGMEEQIPRRARCPYRRLSKHDAATFYETATVGRKEHEHPKADRPSLSRWTLPASRRPRPLAVAISSGTVQDGARMPQGARKTRWRRL